MDADGHEGGNGRAGRVWFWAAVAIFLAAAVYVIAATATGSDLTDARDDIPLLILGVAGVVSLSGWWRDRARRAGVEEAARLERESLENDLQEREESLSRAREELAASRESEDAHRRDLQRLQSRLQERESQLGRERHLRMRSERAHQVERDWGRELHSEVMRLSRERGALGDPSDVPSMVLRLAKTLVGAEKALLFSRKEGVDKLDLLAAEGFEEDPKDSALVKRFAAEVLERDQTVREENPTLAHGDGRSPADEEINNLVALPIYLQDEFGGVVVCANNPEGFDDFDDEVLLAVGDQASAVLQNAQLQGELRDAYLATVGVLAGAVEVKDPFLSRHSEQVSKYVASVADGFGLPSARREELIFASLLHDVGKIGISERILLKPAGLTPEERSVVELHPRIGYRLVQQVPALRSVAPAILHHHERFDGGGYPSRLKGEQIPLEARIICVADSFDAMISERPYRARATVEDACAELERCAGSQFDPKVARIFTEEVRKNPPVIGDDGSLGDPELEVLRGKHEPILGYGALSVTDNLSLLYSRRHLHEVAAAEAERAALQGSLFGVVMVELAGIADLNLTEGYAVGDEAIRSAALVVQGAVARHGGTPCRYSGNRLALIVPGTDETIASSVAASIADGLPEFLKARTATAVWRPAETGEMVISRARMGLDGPGEPETTTLP